MKLLPTALVLLALYTTLVYCATDEQKLENKADNQEFENKADEQELENIADEAANSQRVSRSLYCRIICRSKSCSRLMKILKRRCGCPCRPSINVCLLPKVTGPCKAYIPRYYFDRKSGQCKRFIYGGCGGNGNNFTSLKACQKKCVCSLPKVVGPCRAAFRRYYYNSRTKRCERFIYGGCRGNGNNFTSLWACQRTCGRRIIYKG